MVDKEEFNELEQSIELTVFLNSCTRHMESTKDQLTKK